MNVLKHIVDFLKAAGRDIDHVVLALVQLVAHYYGPEITKVGIEAVKSGLLNYAASAEKTYLTRVFSADTIQQKTGLSQNDSYALASHLMSLAERGGVDLLDHFAAHLESAVAPAVAPAA